MEFRTSIPIPQAEPKITYESKIFLVGSCFVENMGRKLDYYKLPHLQNPFGILFHPAAIAKFFKNIAEDAVYTEEDIFLHNEQWHCFDAHSGLNHSEKNRLLENLNSGLTSARNFLQKSTHLVITLGTAWSYYHLETGQTVANCHKIPQKAFRKELQSTEAVQKYLIEILKNLAQINPGLDVIFTVSPVRHLKDGFIENQRSKANLISAVHQVCDNRKECHYFPSYELMMDELRDYRFYAEDMLHPSTIAINYIWKRFVETWFSEEALTILDEIESIQKGLAHRPFNPESTAHLDFVKRLEEQILKLQKDHPKIKF